MAKRTCPQSCPICYVYDGFKVQEYPYFVYEVSIYKTFNNYFGILDTKVFKSKKLLKVKYTKVLKRTKEYQIIQFIDILGVPKSFIEENNLSLYKPPEKRKRNEKRKN